MNKIDKEKVLQFKYDKLQFNELLKKEIRFLEIINSHPFGIEQIRKGIKNHIEELKKLYSSGKLISDIKDYTYPKMSKYECDECHKEFESWEFIKWENSYGVKFENCEKCSKRLIKQTGGKISPK